MRALLGLSDAPASHHFLISLEYVLLAEMAEESGNLTQQRKERDVKINKLISVFASSDARTNFDKRVEEMQDSYIGHHLSPHRYTCKGMYCPRIPGL